jgi:hypothetical protein
MSPRYSTSVVPMSVNVVLERDAEDDALVGILEDVGVVVVEQLAHHDVAALDQAQRLALRQVGVFGQELRSPGSGGVDQRTRAQRVSAPSLRFSVTCHALASRRASVQIQRVSTVAPCDAASMALSTTSRASSTQPSE